MHDVFWILNLVLVGVGNKPVLLLSLSSSSCHREHTAIYNVTEQCQNGWSFSKLNYKSDAKIYVVVQ